MLDPKVYRLAWESDAADCRIGPTEWKHWTAQLFVGLRKCSASFLKVGWLYL